MSQIFHTTGELVDPEHVTLDRPVPVASGKVRLTVELVSGEKKHDLREFMEQMWKEQCDRGHVPRKKQEIDEYLKAERDSWDS